MRRILFVLALLPPRFVAHSVPRLPQAPQSPARDFVALAMAHACMPSCGEGPPVVLVHGSRASERVARHDRSARRARPPRDRDRPAGHGHLTRDGDEFTLEANARELRELLDALDLTDVTVVGRATAAARRSRRRISKPPVRGDPRIARSCSGSAACGRAQRDRPRS
jgi:hypothetical protein